MARTQANIYLTIWADPDFRRLSPDAQWLYFVMLTHESLNYCGVMDWRPARLAAMSAGMTVQRVEQAAWELGCGRFIAVDEHTEEAVVRSFVRHDGVLKQPNPTKGLVREYGGIASLLIMEIVAREVRRALEENPDWKGADEAQVVAKQFPEPFDLGSWNPSDWVPFRFDLGSIFDTPKKGEPFDLPSSTSTSTSTSTYVENTCVKSDELIPKPGGFAEFWDAYPKDDNEFGAAQAWTEATKHAPPAEIIKAARAYAADPNLPEPRWIPQAKTWLKERRWTHGPLPAKGTPRNAAPSTDDRVQGWLDLAQEIHDQQDAGRLEIQP